MWVFSEFELISCWIGFSPEWEGRQGTPCKYTGLTNCQVVLQDVHEGTSLGLDILLHLLPKMQDKETNTHTKTDPSSAGSFIFFEKSFQLFFLPLTEVKAYMEGGQFTPPLDAQGILGGLLAAAPLKFSHSHLGFGFLCSVSSTNMFPSAFIFKKCVEVFHLQKTFLPSFFTATDVFLSSLQHCHFSGISGKEGNILICSINRLAPDTSSPWDGVFENECHWSKSIHLLSLFLCLT